MVVIGMHNIIPIGPNNQPQNNRERKTTRVDNPNPFPSIRGSKKLPSKLLISTSMELRDTIVFHVS